MRRQSTSLPARRGLRGRGVQRSPGSRALLLATSLAVLSVAAVGCGSSNNTTTSTGTSTPATTPAATAPATSTPAATANSLTGTWKGQYGGTYSGTFVLKWQQSGSNLSGTISLSAPAGTLNIHGTLSGSSISFGTVGSLAITYSGSVSGNSMSGNYQVAGSPGGSWSASKS